MKKKSNESNQVLQQIANQVRGLSIDAIKCANSGHLGLPLGCAEFGSLLFGRLLNYNPTNPRWLNRDRFVLSAGHGSALLYSLLHLSGFGLTIEDLKSFRKLGSNTPGHPEFGRTHGVEATTGPLGQGIGNAVGMAVSMKQCAATFNTSSHTIFDSFVVCLCGDGCLQEGVACESIALAGHWGLDNLILFHDANNVTLDGPLAASQSENTAAKFESMGWQVQSVSGYDFDAMEAAYSIAKSRTGKPQLIQLNTVIGKGISSVEGNSSAHGTTGLQFSDEAKKALGLPDSQFFVSEATRKFFKEHLMDLQSKYKEWDAVFADYCKKYPEKATMLSEKKVLSKKFWSDINFDNKKSIATRAASGEVLRNLSEQLPLLVSGSADLHESTKNYIPSVGVFSKNSPNGRNILFGIREHAMGAILNGIAYDGILASSCATFLSFSDYMRPAIRMAAISNLPVTYIFTHDSIAVGEDGPTHQPVEQLAGLRVIPNLNVIRPADAYETVGAYKVALESSDKPTAIILSRQNLKILNTISSDAKIYNVENGAYVIKEATNLEYIIIATGSEVALALDVAELLGPTTRVVSMPSMNLFEAQSKEYKASILPKTCTKRIAIELGVPHLWCPYVGDNGLILGVNSFGESANESALLEKFGLSPQLCFEKIKQHSF